MVVVALACESEGERANELPHSSMDERKYGLVLRKLAAIRRVIGSHRSVPACLPGPEYREGLRVGA